MARPTGASKWVALSCLVATPVFAQVESSPQPTAVLSPPAPAAMQGQQSGSAQEEPAPCPAPGERLEVKKKSKLAQDTVAAAGGTAAQIGAATVLGPIGAAAAAALGAQAGKKAGGAIKTKKVVDAQEATPGCDQTSAQASQATKDELAGSSPASADPGE